MSADALYHETGLKGYRIEDGWESKGGALFVLVSVPRESLDCRKCGCGRVHLQESRQRFWKSAPLGTTPVFVTMKTPRVKCLRCDSKKWHQPTFAEGQRRVTKGFERCLEAWLSRVTIQDAVEVFGVSWNTVFETDIQRLKKRSEERRVLASEVVIGEPESQSCFGVPPLLAESIYQSRGIWPFVCNTPLRHYRTSIFPLADFVSSGTEIPYSLGTAEEFQAQFRLTVLLLRLPDPATRNTTVSHDTSEGKP